MVILSIHNIRFLAFFTGSEAKNNLFYIKNSEFKKLHNHDEFNNNRYKFNIKLG